MKSATTDNTFLFLLGIFIASAHSAFDLSSLVGTAALRIETTWYFRDTREWPSLNFGAAVANVGDMNGDGLSEVLISEHDRNPSGTSGSGGLAHLIFGTRTPLPVLNVQSELSTGRIFSLKGEASGGMMGFSLAAAGDVNCDGLADAIIGAPEAAPPQGGLNRAGRVYVLLGSNSSWPRELMSEHMMGIYGFSIHTTTPNAYLGIDVSGIGDVNDDGCDDLAIAMPGTSSVVVVFGHPGTWAASNDVADLLSSGHAVRLEGDSYQSFSMMLTTAPLGDVNCDGIDDFIVGAEYANPNGVDEAGQAIVVFGRKLWTSVVQLGSINGSSGVAFTGTSSGAHVGGAVGNAGDVNGDEVPDVFIGMRAPDGNVHSFVIFGTCNGTWPSGTSLSALDGTDGFRISLPNTTCTCSDARFFSTALVGRGSGDFNGDGKTDFVGGVLPTAYALLFGKGSGSLWPALVSDLQSANGLEFRDWQPLARASAALGKDFNGDGLADLIVGAIPVAYDSGYAYLVFGNLSASFSSQPSSSMSGRKAASSSLSASDALEFPSVPSSLIADPSSTVVTQNGGSTATALGVGIGVGLGVPIIAAAVASAVLVVLHQQKRKRYGAAFEINSKRRTELVSELSPQNSGSLRSGGSATDTLQTGIELQTH